MIYFIHGDIKKGFEKARALEDSMLKKKPDAEVFKMSSDNFNENSLAEMIGGQSLFSKKYIVQMSRLLDDENASGLVMKNLKEIAESENVFIWIEADVKKVDLNKIEKKSEKVQEVSGGVAKTAKKAGSGFGDASGFNIFSLADAFGQRDRKKLWVLYLEALKNSRPEEIHGTLWWQLKSIILTTKTSSAKEAGMKDFPYNKAKKYAMNFTEKELVDLSEKMIEIYHEARRSGADLEVRLERFLLSI